MVENFIYCKNKSKCNEILEFVVHYLRIIYEASG